MITRIVAAALTATLLFGTPARAQAPGAFEFVALGDMPYNIPEDLEKFDRLIDRVNALQPAFTLHVGDIISGRTLCSDENYARVKTHLDRFAGALVYTPGDNEWTDCHRFLGGRHDPIERLAALRRMFFPDPGKSLGRMPIKVESQSRNMAERFGHYVENVRFTKNDIHFASVHVVGSLNNFDGSRPETVQEYEKRNAANIAWIDAAFRQAQQASARGLVLFWQANVHATPRRDPGADFAIPFRGTIEAVTRGAAVFNKPVLVVYGDFHFFEVRPFLDLKKRPVANVTRLQVYGDRQVHAVRIRVDPQDPALFNIAPLLVPENGMP